MKEVLAGVVVVWAAASMEGGCLERAIAGVVAGVIAYSLMSSGEGTRTQRKP